MNFDIIKLDKFPFLIAILFSMSSWGIIHIVDRLIKEPLIEYSVSSVHKDDTTVLTYKIRNITSDNVFKEINFSIHSTDSLYSVLPVIIAPMQIDPNNEQVQKKRSYQYTLTDFQPKGTFQLIVKKHDKSVPSLRVRSLLGNTIILSQPTWETWLLKNEFVVLIWLIASCLVLILIYFIISIFAK